LPEALAPIALADELELLLDLARRAPFGGKLPLVGSASDASYAAA